MDYSGLE